MELLAVPLSLLAFVLFALLAVRHGRDTRGLTDRDGRWSADVVAQDEGAWLTAVPDRGAGS